MKNNIENNKKALVLYHREDVDGVLSGAIMKRYLERGGYSTKPYGVNYADLSTIWKEYTEQHTGKLVEWMNKYESVAMVDISFSEPEAMEFVFDHWEENFIWCDHHAPVIKESEHRNFGGAAGFRDTGCSAILLTWTHCFPGMFLPDEFIRLSDYDSWTWTRIDNYKDPKEKDRLFAFNTGVTRKSNLRIAWFTDLVDALLDGSGPSMTYYQGIMNECQEYGDFLLTLDYDRTDRAIRTHGDCSWLLDEEKACMLITTDRFNSDSFLHARNAGIIPADIIHGITLKRNSDGVWIGSAYNLDDHIGLNCGEYLKSQYGGGGHPGAAGCTLTEEQVFEILRNHKM